MSDKPRSKSVAWSLSVAINPDEHRGAVHIPLIQEAIAVFNEFCAAHKPHRTRMRATEGYLWFEARTMDQ